MRPIIMSSMGSRLRIVAGGGDSISLDIFSHLSVSGVRRLDVRNRAIVRSDSDSGTLVLKGENSPLRDQVFY